MLFKLGLNGELRVEIIPPRCLTKGKELSYYASFIGIEHYLAITVRFTNDLMAWKNDYDIMFNEEEYRYIYIKI